MATDVSAVSERNFQSARRGPEQMVQTCVALLGYDPRTEVVLLASENLPQMLALSVPVGVMFGHPLRRWFPPDVIHKLRNAAAMTFPGARREFVTSLPDAETPLDLYLGRNRSCVLLELCRADPCPALAPHVLRDANRLSEMLAYCQDAADVPQRTAGVMRVLTGYDHVAVLRLRPDGRFVVLASDAVSGRGVDITAELPPGTVLPHGKRYILHDMDAPLAAIIRASKLPEAELGTVLFRAAPPAYADALRCHGHKAAMDLPLWVQGRLWGSLSFRHGAARLPSAHLRQVHRAVLPRIEAQIARLLG